jgi:hypothetical protein
VSILSLVPNNDSLTECLISRASMDARAIGDGVRRQVLSEAVHSMLEDSSICMKLADDGDGIYGPAI